MEKPVIFLQKYELDELLISRDISEDNLEEKDLSLTAKVAITEDKMHGAVKLVVLLVDREHGKKLTATITGYFDLNIEENIFEVLYVNGTAILYPYLRSIVSIVSAIDSSEAMLLPTINVLELLDDSKTID
ncbi:protein-export chaperone SecB [Streptococcus suis]|uniref:protein-export chaperone SecB n=1 Tax=Streptococcus suis TaxID=1307 RepID=UPI0003F7C2DF|nr:protein-export chaperone SecB [Streptococcus suis]